MTTKKTRKHKAPTVMQPEAASVTTTFAVAGVKCRVPAEFYAWVENQLSGVLVAIDIIVGHPTHRLFDAAEWDALSDEGRSLAKLCVFHILQQYSEQMCHPFMDPLITDLFANYEY